MNCVRREQRNVTCKNQVKRHRLDQTIDKKRWNSIKHFLGGKFVLAEQFESENEEKARVAFLAFTPPTPWCFTQDFPLCGARKRKATRKGKNYHYLFLIKQKERAEKREIICARIWSFHPRFQSYCKTVFPSTTTHHTVLRAFPIQLLPFFPTFS